jgi:hypothetical protein
MALSRRLSVTHDEVFPFGAFLIGEVVSISDYDRSTKDNKVPAILSAKQAAKSSPSGSAPSVSAGSSSSAAA